MKSDLWVRRALALLYIAMIFCPPVGASTTYEATKDWDVTLSASAITAITMNSAGDHYAVGAGSTLYYVNDTGDVEWSTDLSTADTTYNKVVSTDAVTKSVFSDDYIYTIINTSWFRINPATGAVLTQIWNGVADPTALTDLASETAEGGDVNAWTSGNYCYIGNTTGYFTWISDANGFSGVKISDDGKDIIASQNAGVMYGYYYQEYTSTGGFGEVWNLALTGSTSGTVSQYPIKLNISTQACGPSGWNSSRLTLCLPSGTIKSSFSDVRFQAVGYATSTQIPHWIQEYDSYNATLWVKVPTITAGTAYNYIRMDTNLTGASNTEDGSAVFPLYFDHFTTSTLNATRYYWWNATTGGWWNNRQLGATHWELAGSGVGSGWDSPALELNNVTMGSFYNNISFTALLQTQYHNAGIIGLTDNPVSAQPANATGNNSIVVWGENEGVYATVMNTTTGVRSKLMGNVMTFIAGDTYMDHVVEIIRNDLVTRFMVWRGQSYYGSFSGDAYYPLLRPNKTASYTLTETTATNTPLGRRMWPYFGPNTNAGDVAINYAFLRNYTNPEPSITGWYGQYIVGAAQPGGPIGVISPSLNYAYSYGAGTSKATGSQVYSMDTDLTPGGWVSLSNATYHRTLQYDAAVHAFSGGYSYASSSGTPTAKTKTCANAAFSIEGRGSGIIDIIRLDGTRVGTYTAGGVINGVDISDNGLYAVAGSEDGMDYIFSKASTSSWTLLYSSDPGDAVNAVAMSDDGLVVLTGRDNGLLRKYVIAAATTADYYTFAVSKNGAPYTGAAITIEDGGTTGLAYVAYMSGTLDSAGSYSVPLTEGNYYRITIGSSERTEIVHASSNQLVYYYAIGGTTPYQTGVDYQITFNATTNDIWMYYANGSSTGDSVTWNIYRVNGNTLVKTYTNTSNQLPTLFNYTVPADWRNTSYRISMAATHESHAIQHTQIAYVTNATSTGYGILPPGMDSYVKIAIGFVLLLMIGGIFSFITGPEGALVVCVVALGLRLFDVLPVDWTPTIMLCLLFAFIGVLGRKGPER